MQNETSYRRFSKLIFNPKSEITSATHVISYAYDYQGRMFRKVVDGVTNSYV